MPSYSGLWDGVHGEAYALQVDRSPLNRQLGRLLRKGSRSMTRLREVIDTVKSGESINGGAAVTFKRVKEGAVAGDPTSGGGAVEIETVTQIAASQSTTSADAATVNTLVDFDTQPTYPVDKSGNGGGGKLAYAGVS